MTSEDKQKRIKWLRENIHIIDERLQDTNLSAFQLEVLRGHRGALLSQLSDLEDGNSMGAFRMV